MFRPFVKIFWQKQASLYTSPKTWCQTSVQAWSTVRNRVSGISTRTMHQPTTPSLSQTIWPRWASRQFLTLPLVQTLLPVTFGYSLNSEAVVMRQLRRWKRLWRRSLTRSHKRTSIEPSRSCWNGTTRALQPQEITSKGTRVSIKVPKRKKSLENYLMILVIQKLSSALKKWKVISHYSLAIGSGLNPENSVLYQ